MIHGDNLKKEIIRMKGKISVLSLLLSIILIASVNSAAASPLTATINVDPRYLEADVGEIFTVKINITNVEDPGLYSYGFTLSYNTTYVNVTKAEYPAGHFFEGGSAFTVPAILDYAKGEVLFGASILGDEPGRTGSGILSIVNFTGLSVGLASLKIKEVTLLYPNGTEMAYNTNDGSVNVVPEFIPALITLVFMATTLVVVALRKRVLPKKQIVRY